MDLRRILPLLLGLALTACDGGTDQIGANDDDPTDSAGDDDTGTSGSTDETDPATESESESGSVTEDETESGTGTGDDPATELPTDDLPDPDSDTQGVRTIQFGGAADDQGVALAVGDDGNVFVAGQTSGEIYPGVTTSAGALDVFLAKLDSALDLIWVKQWGGALYEGATDLLLDDAGNIYVAGTGNGGINGTSPLGASGHDVFLIKVAPDGAAEWTRAYGSSGLEADAHLAWAADGTLLLAGSSNGSFEGLSPAGGLDAYLLDLDADGEVLWGHMWGSSADDRAVDLIVDATGDILVYGQTTGDLPGNTNAGDGCTLPPCSDVFVTKLDAAGNVLWTRQHGTPDNDTGWSFALAADGSIYAGGASVIAAWPDQTAAGGADGFLLELAADGTLAWASQWGTSYDEWVNGVIVDGSRILVGGLSAGAPLGLENPGEGHSPMVVAFDGTGAILDQLMWGTEMYDHLTSLARDGEGRLLAVGYTYGVFAGQTASGFADVYVSLLPAGW